MNRLDNLKFAVPLSFKAHSIARQLHRLQSNPQKAKQVYLNTLAVYAVNFYLQCLGVETDVEHSDSRNPLYLKFMNVADLRVKSLGKLECLPTLPGVTVCQVPPEVSSERIGYVVVEIDRSLKQATLLGFTSIAVSELPLSQLRSLAELPEYLNHIQQVAKPISDSKILVNLSQWFDNIFEVGWQTVEALLTTRGTDLAFSSRSTKDLRESFTENSDVSICGGKLIDLGMQLAEQQVALIVKLMPKSELEVDIRLRVYPAFGQVYLPPGLQLVVWDESGNNSQAKARSMDNWIQLEFSAAEGESFSVKVALGDVSVEENFVI